MMRRWWSVVASLLVAAIFAQAAFAGLMLSGAEWARSAHMATAVGLIAATLISGLVAAVALRQVAQGVRFALILLSLAVLVFAQTAIGKLSAEGGNLLWLHVPLGVALVGVAGQAVAAARRLGA